MVESTEWKFESMTDLLTYGLTWVGARASKNNQGIPHSDFPNFSPAFNVFSVRASALNIL